MIVIDRHSPGSARPAKDCLRRYLSAHGGFNEGRLTTHLGRSPQLSRLDSCAPGTCPLSLARLSQLDPDLGNFADGLNGNWLIGLARSRKNSGKAAAVPTK
jgi:hypothetical protein